MGGGGSHLADPWGCILEYPSIGGPASMPIIIIMENVHLSLHTDFPEVTLYINLAVHTFAYTNGYFLQLKHSTSLMYTIL